MDSERECRHPMEERCWQAEEQKEDISYPHRSHSCDLFFYANIFDRGDIVFESIKKNRDFVRVYHHGKSYANKYLVMYVLNNDLVENRFGITVSKKVGNSVVRQRTTRLIRESIRLHLNEFEKGLDIVIVARHTAKGRKYLEIESALLHLGRLHRIIRDDFK